MSVLDIIILLLLIFGFIRGVFKGFVLELSGLIGIVISIYLAKYYADPAIRLTESLLGIDREILPVIAFLITFLIALLLFHFIAVLIDKFISLIALAWLNKLLGGFLSFIKYLIVISVFINIFDLANTRLDIVDTKTFYKSKMYFPVQKVVPTILPFLHLEDLLQSLKEK